MTNTLGSIAEKILGCLQGSGTTNNLMATLTQDISTTDLTFTVDDTTVLSRGLVEIDREQIWVSSVSTTAATIAPWGRGWRGTTSAAHTSGSAIRVSPTWPMSTIYTQINNATMALYPGIFAVKTYDFTISGGYFQFGLPADVEVVLDVSTSWTMLSGWEPVTSWDTTMDANLTDFPTGRMLSLDCSVTPSTRVKVTYAARPILMSNPSDLFSVTGLAASQKDLLVLGAALRLFPWVDVSRVAEQSVEAGALAKGGQLGASVSMARDFRSEYQRRLGEERAALNAKYGRRAHRVR
jgi:hypothetical protein